MDSALIGVGGTIAGTVLGWLLSSGTASKERKHQATELVKQRREAAAVALSSELERLDEALPKPSTPSDQAVTQLQEAAGLLRRCEKRGAFIEDDGITARLHSLYYALWTANDEAEEKAERGQNTNIWSLAIAIGDLYAAVDAYQLRKPAPAPVFPSVDELRELVGVDPGGMQKINRAARLRRVAAGEAQPSV